MLGILVLDFEASCGQCGGGLLRLFQAIIVQLRLSNLLNKRAMLDFLDLDRRRLWLDSLEEVGAGVVVICVHLQAFYRLVISLITDQSMGHLDILQSQHPVFLIA